MNDMNFGPILKAMRKKKRWSQEELALRLNRSRSCISKLEKDLKTLDMNTAIRWCHETGATEVLVAFICGMDGLSILQNLLNVSGVALFGLFL